MGDASTKFFHANATMKYRRNLIATLEDTAGNSVTAHEEKAALIWDSFKERLGISTFTGIHFNLSTLLQNGQDFASLLVAPFEKQEIDSVVKHLPSGKSLGPDSFNTDFVKK